MTKKNNGVTSILKQNLWPLIVVIAGWLVGFALLQARVSTLEASVKEYPSQDWFELKFENIEQRFQVIEKQLVDLKQQLKVK